MRNRDAFVRFSLCAFLNAVALSFMAILQFISSPPNVIYWTFRAPNGIFGTFLCRNHFPFYVNMGLGLGLGMFFAVMDRGDDRGRSEERKSRRSRRIELAFEDAGSEPFPKNLILRIAGWIQALLSNPTALWICAGIALIVCADFLSLSRGGVVALAGASLACLIYKSFSLSSRSLSAGVVVIFALAFGLVNWLGWNIVEARLGTLITKDALSNRTPMWSDSLKGFWDAPIFGSGYGTFQYVEAMHRTQIGDVIVIFDHAHNDYLEAAIEGGICRLLAALGAIVFVYVAGFRSLRRLAGERDADFVLGALVAFTTVVIHSFGEFGLFTPAVTVMAAVLVAQICGSEVWSRERRGRKPSLAVPTVSFYALRLGGLAPVMGVLLAFVVATMLIIEGYRADWQVRYRNAADKLRNADTDVSERRIALLQEAIRWGSDSAWSHLELGEVYLTAYQNRIDLLDQFATLQPALCFTIPLGNRDIASLETALASAVAERATLEQIVPGYESGVEREYLGPALRYFIQARNLCPLLARAQLRLVALSAKLQLGDPPSRYLDRAKIVAGYDPEFWFMGGTLALAEKRPDDCWPQWKRSLEISRKHFKQIIDQSRASLTPKQVLHKVLPDDAAMIVETANLLLRDPKDAEERAVRMEYFKRAASLLRQETSEIKADGWIVRAMVFEESGQYTNAIAALRMGMSLDPKYEDLRLDLAKLLLNNGDKAQAIRELGIVITRHPQNREANQLYNELLMKK